MDVGLVSSLHGRNGCSLNGLCLSFAVQAECTPVLKQIPWYDISTGNTAEQAKQSRAYIYCLLIVLSISPAN